MAKKKGGDHNNNNNGGGAKKEDGGKKDVGMNVVVLKIDLHCEGCAAKVIKAVRSFDGVESAKVGDGDLTKLTVVGKVDPTKLREKVEAKTKKKAEVISPVAKKDKNEDVEKENNGGGGEVKKQKQQQQEKSDEKKNNTNKKDESKAKELPVTTAVLKVNWHCQGCIQKIHKVVSKSKGYMEMSIDKHKDLVTVKGAIDVKALVEKLKEKLKRPVEIVPPKKEGGGGDKAKSGGEKAKGNGNSNGNGGSGGGGEEKAAKGNGNGNGGGKVVEGHKMEYGVGQGEYPYHYDGYGSGYTINQVHAPQLFSDENPNACVVM